MKNVKKYVTINDGVDFRTIAKIMTNNGNDNKSAIYFIRNKKNNRIYIGSAVDYKRRKIEHKKLLKSQKHYNAYMLNDYNKFDMKFEDVFSFEVKEFVFDKNDLLDREQYYLDLFFDKQDKCYNIAPLAGNALGVKWTDEQKKNQSKKRKGKGNPMWNKKHSKKTKLLMSKRQKKKVEQLDGNGNIVNIFDSITNAAKMVGLSRQMIGHCCNGNRKSGKGFTWRFVV